MNINKIFFSYARSDASDFTLRLALDLKAEGFNVWIDQQDIRAGTEWDIEIEKALETCDCLLFIESANSVTSNNVLDEVYYALEQRKRVIPIIYHDSKTPFRIQRLQHIDFMQDYDKGLKNLVKELKRDSPVNQLQTGETAAPPAKHTTFFQQHVKLLSGLFLLLILLVTGFIYFTGHKTEPAVVSVVNVDTATTLLVPQEQPKETGTETTEPPPEAEEKRPKKTKQSIQVPVTKPETTPAKKTKPAFDDAAGQYEGYWQLVSVEPRQGSHRGYIKIEALDDKKIKITSTFQFYFPQSDQLARFVVFNGVAACAACILKDEILITDKDAAFGTTRYEVLERDKPGEGKAGDTVSTIGGNSTVEARVTLQLVDKTTALIKVQQPARTPISNGFVVEPFAYTFRFRKNM